jgi:hypothetical protein
MMEAGVVAVDNPTANRLTIHILAAVAQHEREMISERTKAFLRAARARGKRLGNPKLADVRAKGLQSNKVAADRFAANVVPIIRQIQKHGMGSFAGIAEALNERGARQLHLVDAICVFRLTVASSHPHELEWERACRKSSTFLERSGPGTASMMRSEKRSR